MSISSQYFEVIANYAGIKGYANFIPVMKGDVRRFYWIQLNQLQKKEYRNQIHGIMILFSIILKVLDYFLRLNRQRIRECLRQIRLKGDEQDQSELINAGYGRALIISVSTAGGTEEQGDDEIYSGLNHIYWFITLLHQGRYNYPHPLFPAQPALSKSCIEQIEEEGGNEEVEAQLYNNGKNDNIIDEAIEAKGEMMNIYFDRNNPKPWWYNWRV
ncbi:MAG: hypothetical protein EZS28_033728 [Streblomastix strix]|uniref:Uncharacterized protein n=1 Tax=Streblomastix strix TaxID=222440 RepID=A0A5J4ULZ8_9EUKA|nr:MAG: hypothetical protein EZS28_033728 [Streblomastix strix]